MHIWRIVDEDGEQIVLVCARDEQHVYAILDGEVAFGLDARPLGESGLKPSKLDPVVAKAIGWTDIDTNERNLATDLNLGEFIVLEPDLHSSTRAGAGIQGASSDTPSSSTQGA